MKGTSHVIIGLAGLALLQTDGAALLNGLGRAVGRDLALSGNFVRLDALAPAGAALVAAAGFACVIGALAPDIDHPNATLRGTLGLASHQTAWEVALRFGRMVGGQALGWALAVLLWLPVALYRLIVKTALDVTLEHRGPTHTVWALLLVGLLAWLLPWPLVGVAFAVGYGLHIAADMLTKSGVPLVWPWQRAFGLLPKFLRFETGSVWEWLVVAGWVALALWRWRVA